MIYSLPSTIFPIYLPKYSASATTRPWSVSRTAVSPALGTRQGELPAARDVPLQQGLLLPEEAGMAHRDDISGRSFQGGEEEVCTNMRMRVGGVLEVELGVAGVGLRERFLMCPTKESSCILYL